MGGKTDHPQEPAGETPLDCRLSTIYSRLTPNLPPPRSSFENAHWVAKKDLLEVKVCSYLKYHEISKYQRTLKYRNIMSPHIPESSVKVAAFWEIPKKLDQNLAKIQQNSGIKFCNFYQKISRKFNDF